jgi:serine/threonine-protein kinase
MARFPTDDSPELDAILDQALDLPADERAAFLDEACRGRPELRAQVDHILAGADRENVLDRPIGELASSLLGEPEEAATARDLTGRRVGPYRIAREIGRGGMGAVYLAERDEAEFRQRVAIKLLRSTSSPEHLLERFLGERRILARLEHPHIARLYDGSVTDDGEPYFVMEHVEGLPIDAYADERRLSVDARLELFDQVCDAVDYAHRHLVVHRDLKPSNILVTAEGQVKLLDFGIAKLLVDDDAASGPVTKTGYAVLTPDYASPEQFSGQSVSTASDVYSLGVLLYELLTGARPYTFTSPSLVEIARTVIEEEPARPSTLFGSEATPEAAACRGTTNEHLRRRLHGDLDTIVLMALRKEPERRYASVSQLREDLRRHHDNLPVRARPNTLGYRAGKLIVRHRTAAALALLVAVSLIGGLVGTTWQARKAAREARTAERITAFLTGLFRASDPNEFPGVELSARDLLDRGAERLDDELAAEPATQAELFSVIGKLYFELGLYDEARPLLERALAIQTELHGETHVETAKALGELVMVLHGAGDFESAEESARRVLEIRRQLLTADSPDLAASLTDLAAILSAQGRYAEAEPLYREALAIDRKHAPRHLVADDLNNLGTFLMDAGKYEESRAAHEEALEIRTALYGDRHTDVATSLSNLGLTLARLGEPEESETMLRAAVDLRLELLGEDHPHTAISLNNLAEVMRERGDYEGARATHLRALEIRRATFGDEHPETAASLNNLGVVCYFQMDYVQAEMYFHDALRAFRGSLGEDHPHVMTGVNNLASTLREQDKLDEAEALFRENLKRRRQLLGEDHPAVNEGRSNLGWLLLKRERFEEARSEFAATVARDLEIHGEDHPTTSNNYLGLGRSLLGLERADEAETALRESLRIRRIKYGDDDSRTASAATWLGICLSTLERHEEAAPLLEQNLALVRPVLGDEHPTVRTGQSALDASRAAGGRPAEPQSSPQR